MNNLERYESEIELYTRIFYLCLILTVIFLIISIVLFIRFRVIEIYGELSGKYKMKEIADFAKSDWKKTIPRKIKQEEVKREEKIQERQTVTTKINKGFETTVLSGNDKGRLSKNNLHLENILLEWSKEYPEDSSYTVEKSIIFIHTDEII